VCVWSDVQRFSSHGEDFSPVIADSALQTPAAASAAAAAVSAVESSSSVDVRVSANNVDDSQLSSTLDQVDASQQLVTTKSPAVSELLLLLHDIR